MGGTPTFPGNNDIDTSIADLKARVRDFVLEREWLPYHHPKELAVSIAIEAAELLEIFQWEEKQPLERLKKDAEIRGRLQDEIADVQIYLLSLAAQTDIDISRAVRCKLARNEERYSVADVLKTGRYRKDRTRPPDAQSEGGA